VPDPQLYTKSAAEANKVTAGISDPILRKVASAAITKHLVDVADDRYLTHPTNVSYLVGSVLLTSFACASLIWAWPLWASGVIAALIDISVFYLLLIVGMHGDGIANVWNKMPHRIPALLMGALLFGALICSFANFSCVTITTLGYGDYSAGTPRARKLVIWQLLSGFSLILVFFPLVVSRMANY
jgi:hypothetical protein